MGTSFSMCCNNRGKSYTKKQRKKEHKTGNEQQKKRGGKKHQRQPDKGKAVKGKGRGHPQQPEADDSDVNYAINRGNITDINKICDENTNENHYVRPEINENGGGFENKEKRKTKGKGKGKGRRYLDSDDSSDSSSPSSSSSSSSDDGVGKTTKSKLKKKNKDGSVTFIKNKTTIGSSKISFKAGNNINIYKNKNVHTTVQPKPEKPRELFKKEYTEETAKIEEQKLFSILREQQSVPGHFVDLRGSDNVQSVFDIGILHDCARSVGQISSPVGSCTCLRVGTKYVMTAFHAITYIINNFVDHVPVQESTTQGKSPGLSVLSEHSVFVDFDFLLKGHQSTDRNKFNFKQIQTTDEIPFFDVETDVIVLELVTRIDQRLPSNFTNFGIPKLDKAFHLITHSSGNPKEIDKVTKIVDGENQQTKDDIKFLLAESTRYMEANGENAFMCHTPPYDSIDNRERLLFQCASNKGGSGSPGIQVTASGQAVVVTMLLHGYPDWYYDRKCEYLKANWPKHYTIEQGANFASVWSKMWEKNSTLCDEIFSTHNQSARSSVHGIQVVQPADENC